MEKARLGTSFFTVLPPLSSLSRAPCIFFSLFLPSFSFVVQRWTHVLLLIYQITTFLVISIRFLTFRIRSLIFLSFVPFLRNLNLYFRRELFYIKLFRRNRYFLKLFMVLYNFFFQIISKFDISYRFQKYEIIGNLSRWICLNTLHLNQEKKNYFTFSTNISTN